MYQKGLSPILIIILIAAVLGGLVIYQQQNSQLKPNTPAQLTSQSTFTSPTTKPSPIDETAGWKTYTNNKYGYSLKYPQNWGIQECPKGQINEPLALGPEFVSNANQYCNTDIVTTLNLHLGNTPWQPNKLPILNKQESIVDGKSIVIYTIDNKSEPGAKQFMDTSIRFNDTNNLNYLEIRLNNLEYKDIFNQILSTFKFTE